MNLGFDIELEYGKCLHVLYDGMMQIETSQIWNVLLLNDILNPQMFRYKL